MMFRDLRADEIECRIGQFKEGAGVSLLLYKDARCDMAILDETVGAMNWRREHSRDNANCTVSIWDANKGQWISKEDTGTESKTEAEKGLASDSFKRACVNWGIGRELYTSPRIWISGAGKYDRFWVKDIGIENKTVTRLVICCCDSYGNKLDDVAFEYPRKAQPKPDGKAVALKLKAVRKTLKELGVPEDWMCKKYDVEKLEDLSEDQLDQIGRNAEKARVAYERENG